MVYCSRLQAMTLPRAMTDWARQRDPHTGLRLTTLTWGGCMVLPSARRDWEGQIKPHTGPGIHPELWGKSTRPPHALLVQKDRCYYGKQRYNVAYGWGRGEEEGEGEDGSFYVDRGIHDEELKVVRSRPRWVAWLLPRDIVISGPDLLPEPISALMIPMQPQTVMVSTASETTEGWKDRTVQNWPHPSLAATPGKTAPTHH